MANEQGGVIVRFSVQNAEVVRNALAALGKDGDKALKQLDTAAQPVNAKLQGISDIIDVARGRMAGYAAQGGMLGQVVGRWGPAGFAAAAGLGLAHVALSKLSEITEQYVEKAKRVRELSQTLQLTGSEVQTLGRYAGRAGVDFEEVTSAVGKFTIAMEQARTGQGDLFEQVRKISPALALELAATQSNSEALDVYSRALERAGNARNVLLRAGLGRGGLESGRALDLLRQAGGLGSASAADSAAGKNVADEEIETLRKLRLEIDQTYASANKMWAQLSAKHDLEWQRQMAKIWEGLALSAKSIAALDWRTLADATVLNLGGKLRPKITVTPPEQPSDPLPQIGPIPRPNQQKIDAKVIAERELALGLEKERIALLGQAATPAEQLALRELELKVAIDKGAASTEVANRALGAFKRSQEQAAAAARERIGVSSQDELLTARLADLQDQYAKGYIRTAKEMAEAERLVRKEVRETYEQLEVRKSALPGLKQLEIDAGHLDKAFDQLGTSGIGTLSSGLADIELGTKKTSDGFAEMAKSFGRMVLEMVNRMALAATVGRALQAMFSYFGGGQTGSYQMGETTVPVFGTPTRSAKGNAFAGIQRFAKGSAFVNSIVTRPTLFRFGNGGLGEMGEKGIEGILPLRRNARGELGVIGGGGGRPVQVNLQTINNSSARVSTTQRQNSSGGVDIVQMIDETVAGSIQSGQGRTHEALVQRFGLNPTKGMS